MASQDYSFAISKKESKEHENLHSPSNILSTECKAKVNDFYLQCQNQSTITFLQLHINHIAKFTLIG